MSTAAFDLRDEYRGDVTDENGAVVLIDGEPVAKFQGGVVGYGPDGHSFNVGEAVADDGPFVVEGPALIERLREHPALVEVAAPADAPVIETAPEPLPAGALDEPYERHKADDLRAFAKACGLEADRATKAETVAALRELDAGADVADVNATLNPED